MDNKSKILILVLALFLALFILNNYYNIFVKNDYIVTKQIPCDPNVYSCFVSDCESNDPTCDSKTTYMRIEVPSKYAGSDYNSLSCSENSSFCKIITCQASTIESGEKCFK